VYLCTLTVDAKALDNEGIEKSGGRDVSNVPLREKNA
jgi:hypothetical protein